jgi:hypothetical protein
LKPQDKKTTQPNAFTPIQRKLIFDIDMTDYDSIRTCCSGADICKRCWGFIGAVVHVLDSAIRQQFGYNLQASTLGLLGWALPASVRITQVMFIFLMPHNVWLDCDPVWLWPQRIQNFREE